MKPARSVTSTASLPQAVAKALAAAMVSSLAVSGRTTSTSFITGAGLKKWMPQTRSGRLVCTASSTTGSVEVLVARIAVRLDDLLELDEQRLLDGEVLDHRLDHQVAVEQVAEVVGGGDAGEDGLALGVVELALLDLLGQALVEARGQGVGARRGARAHDHLVAGLGGHLGQAGAHDPRADDPDRRDARAPWR